MMKLPDCFSGTDHPKKLQRNPSSFRLFEWFKLNAYNHGGGVKRNEYIEENLAYIGEIPP